MLGTITDSAAGKRPFPSPPLVALPLLVAFSLGSVAPRLHYTHWKHKAKTEARRCAAWPGCLDGKGLHLAVGKQFQRWTAWAGGRGGPVAGELVVAGAGKRTEDGSRVGKDPHLAVGKWAAAGADASRVGKDPHLAVGKWAAAGADASRVGKDPHLAVGKWAAAGKLVEAEADRSHGGKDPHLAVGK